MSGGELFDDDKDVNNTRTLDNTRSFDDVLTEDEIHWILSSQSKFAGQPWIEECFNGSRSKDFYLGLACGYYHSLRIKKQRETIAWSLWVNGIIRFILEKVRSLDA